MSGWARREYSFVAAFAVALIAGAALLWWPRGAAPGRADPGDPAQTSRGRVVYDARCASCHGAALQGQPDWRERKPDGKLPAPPQDGSGHTWHHPDAQLFGIVKNGVGPYAPAGYRSDMPAFAATLSDDQIWDALAYIKSKWPSDIRERQAQISRDGSR